MKPVKRIFLILGAMSMFSLFQFNAMGDDNTKKDCNSVDDGRYCWHKDDKNACPAGCYCDGGRNVVAVEKFYNNKTSFEKACALRTLQSMSGSGVHLCPSGKTSNPAGGQHGAKKSSDCFSGLTAWDGTQNCTSEAAKGKYCKHKDVAKENCKPGCYCEGGTNAIGNDGEKWGQVTSACSNHSSDVKNYLEARGVKYCPDGFPKSVSQAKYKDECYFEENSERRYYKDYKDGIYVAPGKYLKKSTTTQTPCPSQGNAVCFGGVLIPSASENVGIDGCSESKGLIPNNDRSDCVCQEGKEWVATQNACVSQHSVTYNCGVGSGTPPADSHNYLVGETVTVKSKGSCQGPGGRVFDKWDCGNIIGDKTPGSLFTMPDADVVCTAKWTAGSGGGGNTGGNGTTCATGQYLVYGTAEPADITQRVDINQGEIEEVSPVLKRTNPNNNKAFAETNANNEKASVEANVNLSRSVVSRAAKLTGFETSLSDVGQSAPKSLRAGVGGTCKDCDAGYYCPDKQHRYRCGDGTYTSATGQTSCQPCNGTVKHPANNSSLNTGCSTVPDNPGNTTYTVTYECGEGSGTPPTDSNPYASGASVTLKSKGNCTAPSAKPNFGGWNCGNNISGQAGDTITMPEADVTCTAQWTAGSGVTCPAGKYMPVGGTLLADCVRCPKGNYCLGNNDHTECTGDTYINVMGSTSASDCHSCPSGEHAVDNHTGCSSNVVHCVAGKYLGADNQCVDCEEGYVCPGGYFEPGSIINGLRLPTDYCNSNQVVNIAQTDCETCTGGAAPNSTQTQCVAGNADCGLGEYVDDDGACQTCPTGRFCPGNGNYYTCPFGSPTSNKASCSFSLNESKLYHGQSTSGNCWKHLNNASNYRDCVYGFHLENLRGN